MAANTVHVTNIPATTEDKEIRDFFSFCGKISDINVAKEGETKTANIIFDKPTAARTALLLNATQLGTNQISVTGGPGDETHPSAESGDGDSHEITQEEKPRARVLAEYLAHGYVIGDAALTKAIDLDQKHGVSKRFLETLTAFDKKMHASDRAKAADQSYGISQKTGGILQSFNSFFEKATTSGTGRKIATFYDNAQKTVLDIHKESRRLADLKTEEAGGDPAKAAGLKVLSVEKKETAAPGAASAPGVSQTGSAPSETAPKFDPPPTA